MRSVLSEETDIVLEGSQVDNMNQSYDERSSLAPLHSVFLITLCHTCAYHCGVIHLEAFTIAKQNLKLWSQISRTVDQTNLFILLIIQSQAFCLDNGKQTSTLVFAF
jgi:hypothetical protein